jgi:3-deoxy-D-manno-octulosonic-acid transferase
MARLLYTLAVVMAMPWALLHLIWRSRRQPEYLHHWNERFGRYGARPDGPVIWIHAVSVGETRAAQPLVAALRERHGDHRILFTHMTPTGRQTSVDLFGDEVMRVYLPYDMPWAVGRFLRHFRPVLGLIMETELWPNLVAACRRRGTPLLLVNARLSARSAGRYARVPSLTRTTLRGLAAIAAQGEDDAERLRRLGAGEVAVLGNMKFDVEPPPAQLALGKDFRARVGARKVFLCASTREGEEALILDAWRR